MAPAEKRDTSRSWFVQFAATMEKNLWLHLKSPVTTLAELTLPFLFMLLLAVACWLTTDRTTAGTPFFGKSIVNATDTYLNAFCINSSLTDEEASSYPAELHKCLADSTTTSCLPNTPYSGLCLIDPAPYTSGLSKLLYASTGVVVPTMDAYLSISAQQSLTARTSRPTFFGRTTALSLSHYGSILLVDPSVKPGENVTEGTVSYAFSEYCKSNSRMCGNVLHSEVYNSFEAANKFAYANDDSVWTIVELSKIDVSSEGGSTHEDGNAFTIHMNYTATPLTFSIAQSVSSGGSDYQYYVWSGFLTLTNFIQGFYVQERRKVYGSSSTSSSLDEMLTFANGHSLMIESMPTHDTHGNKFVSGWGYFLPLIAAMAAMYPVARLIGTIVDEKASMIKESMLIMGLRQSCLYISWLLTTMLKDLIASLLAALILKHGPFPNVSYGVLAVIYFSFSQHNSAFSMFLSTFFSNARLASFTATLIVFLCNIVPYVLTPDSSKVGPRLLSALPCFAFSEVFSTLITYSSMSIPLSFDNLSSGYPSIAEYISLMWVFAVLYWIFALYFDNVLPSTVGRQRCPVFCLMPLFRMCRSKKSEDAASDAEDESQSVAMNEDGTSKMYIEPEKNNGEAAVQVKHLWKVYQNGGVCGMCSSQNNWNVAVRDVSFSLNYGEVNVLLGQNGAGKSSVINMITGMAQATKGDVFICGHNATGDLNSCRKHIGYCPQVDIVWSDLTVAQHLRFYSRMKGTERVEEAIEDTISLLQLSNERDTAAGHLSGGQRRRLCVGIALICNPDVLILDEPTAGMDVEGRRAVYNALHNARDGRSVLISTHLLEEADRIGDRILLMKDGDLKCAGSSLYLKSKMGVGYVVTCVITPDVSTAEEETHINTLTNVVRRHVQSGQSSGAGRDVRLLGVARRGREVSFRFPLSLLSSGSTLFEELESRKYELHLRSVGLNLTSLEDVFTYVAEGQLYRESDATTKTNGSSAVNVGAEEYNVNSSNGNELKQPLVGLVNDEVYADEFGEGDADKYSANNSGFPCSSFFTQFAALFMKRVRYGSRDRRFIFFQVVLPALFLIAALLIGRIPPPTQPAIALDADLYSYSSSDHATTDVLWGQSATFGNVFEMSNDAAVASAAFGPGYAATQVDCQSGRCDEDLSTVLSNEFLNHSAERYIAFALTNAVDPGANRTSVLLHNTSAMHASAQAVGVLYNVVNKQAFAQNSNSKPFTTTRNHPLPMGPFEELLFGIFVRVITGIFLFLPFLFIPSSVVGFMARENENGARHLQWLAGASPAAFWLSSLTFDMICFLITETLVMGTFVIASTDDYMRTPRHFAATSMLFFLYGLSSIPFSYLISFFFRSANHAQNTTLVLNFAIGFLWVMAEEMLDCKDFVRVAMKIMRCVPSVPFAEGMFALAGNQLMHLYYPNQKSTDPFAILVMNEWGTFVGGVGTSLIYMACTFVVCCLLLVALEFARVQRFSRYLKKLPCQSSDTHETDGIVETATDVQTVDESVVQEEAAVCFDPTGKAEDGITMQHITVHYAFRKHPAVQDLSFAVPYGGVTVLLGRNGAGKSSAIGVLTGEVVPASGNAFVNHISTADYRSHKYVGYCPQHDALLVNLSAVEHLQLFAALRGMSALYIKNEIPNLLASLGLTACQNTPAGQLSGGNRRRLSLAIALIGGTTSVLLDEPTSGMDAIARRQMCAIVRRLTRNKSVLLTTHLMDEAEALGDTVAFISNGRLRCIGTPQEVKSKFTEDSTLTVTAVFANSNEHASAASGDQSPLLWADVPLALQRRFMEVLTKNEHAGTQLPACTVGSVVGRTVTLQVRGPLSAICKVCSELKEGTGIAKRFPSVLFVSANQPSLDDILVSFD